MESESRYDIILFTTDIPFVDWLTEYTFSVPFVGQESMPSSKHNDLESSAELDDAHHTEQCMCLSPLPFQT